MVQSFFVCVEEVPDCFISFEMTRYAETFSKILRLKAQNDSNSLSTKVDPTSLSKKLSSMQDIIFSFIYLFFISTL